MFCDAALVFGPLLSGLPALVRAVQQGGQAADVSDAVAMRLAGGVLLAVLLLRHSELVGRRLALGAVLIVAGSVLIGAFR